MSEVAITINGRSYRLGADPGEEHRLRELAAYLGTKIDDLAAQFGRAGHERLLLIAALTIADELLDARALLEAATEPTRPAPDQPPAKDAVHPAPAAPRKPPKPTVA